MSDVAVRIASGNYDRIQAIKSGAVPIEGCAVDYVNLAPPETFRRLFENQEFDIAEMSFSTYLLTRTRFQFPYTAVPVFLSRVFPHSSIYIRTDRGIEGPASLAGKSIGLPEYQITANVWIRGMLHDDYGVKPSDIHWRSGGLEDPGREERSPLNLPPEIDLTPIAGDRTLPEMLAEGELDAVFSARARPSPRMSGLTTRPECDRKRPPSHSE